MGLDSEQAVFANNEFFSNVSARRIPGLRPGGAFGRNMDVDTSSTVDIWGSGGVWVRSPATGVVTLVSDNVADVAAGTGAHNVMLVGLDDDLNEISELVPLNGETPVVSSLEFLRINVAIVVNAGVTDSNVGIITITQTSIQGTILEGEGVALFARYSVPGNEQAEIHVLFGSATRFGPANGAMVRLTITCRKIGTDFAKTILFSQGLAVEKGLDGNLTPPKVVPPGTDIVFTGSDASDANTIVEAGMLFVLREV